MPHMQMRLLLPVMLGMCMVWHLPVHGQGQDTYRQQGQQGSFAGQNPAGGYPPASSFPGGYPPGNYAGQQPGAFQPQGSYQPPGTYQPQNAYPQQGNNPYPGGYGQQSSPYPGTAAPASYPGGAYGARPGGPVPAARPDAATAARVYQWFLKYDEVRRRAQMNPIEKQQSDAIMSRGLSILMPGADKVAAKEILSKLVQRYQLAGQSLAQLPQIPETANLQKGYYQYFDTAGKLFADYLKVQDNLMAQDASGQPIMAALIGRKTALESLERSVKDYDSQVRNTFGIAAYQY